jgi:hypothetical protein
MCASGVQHIVGKLSRRATSLLRPHPNQRFEQGVMSYQSPMSPEKKCHSDVDVAEFRREYYMGEGGGFPQVGAMVSLVSPKSPVARLSTKGAPESELTNLWLVGCKSE